MKLLHQHGQHPVGVGDGKGEPLRAAEPHQAVGELVRVQAGEHRHRGQRAGGHLQAEHQQRRDGGGVAPKEQGHQQQIARLGEHPHSEHQQHQSPANKDPGQLGGDHHQQKAGHQKPQVVDKPGHQPKEQVPHNQNAGVQLGDDGVIVAIGVFQHLVPQKIHGELFQNVLRELFLCLGFHFHHAPSPKQRVNSSTV